MRWANQLKDVPRIKIHSSLEPGQSWGLGYVGIDGIEARALNDFLWNKYRIIGQAMVGGPYPGQQFDYQGMRITPNVYTTLEEIDTFVGAMKDALKNGVPAKNESHGTRVNRRAFLHARQHGAAVGFGLSACAPNDSVDAATPAAAPPRRAAAATGSGQRVVGSGDPDDRRPAAASRCRVRAQGRTSSTTSCWCTTTGTAARACRSRGAPA